jgi:hypothetical protein
MAHVATLAIAIAPAVLTSSEANACRIGHRYLAPETLLQGTGQIALAEVVGIESLEHGARYRFKRIEALRGEVVSEFTIDTDGEERSLVQWDDDFHGHRDPTSGELIGGRTRKWPDCEIHIFFQEGGRYLLFLDTLRDFRGYRPWGSERIVVDDDRWLLTVRRSMTEPGKGDGG